MNEVREEGSEFIRHAAGQDVAVDGDRALVTCLHLEKVRHVEGQQVQNKVLGTLLLQVALAHGLEEVQEELVMLGVFETVDRSKVERLNLLGGFGELDSSGEHFEMDP